MATCRECRQVFGTFEDYGQFSPAEEAVLDALARGADRSCCNTIGASR